MADLWTMNQRRAWPTTDDAAAEQSERAAQQLFEAFASEHGYSVSRSPGSADRPHTLWDTYVGSPPDLIRAVGGASDLIVVTRAPQRRGEKAWIVLDIGQNSSGLSLPMFMRPRDL